MARGTISFGLVLHNHQPVGNFGWVVEDVYRRAYEPMLGAIERHPYVRLSLHYSGPLLDWMRQHAPDAIERIGALARQGRVELLGGGYYEPVLVSIPERDRQAQLRRMADEVERIGGSRPRGAWLAERVWEPSLPATLADGGIAWTVVDDAHLRAASVPDERMFGGYLTEDQGRRLVVFGTEQGLRYRIPFGPVDEVIEYLRAQATPDGRRIGVMGDDGEKFGAWPETFDYCWGPGGWVDELFAAFERHEAWLRTVTISEFLDSNPPLGLVYIPTTSYSEMGEWALPAQEAPAFAAALHHARETHAAEARWLRGGFWRSFIARYREINELHKAMLEASARVDRMPPGAARDGALAALWRAQSNDVYWHGLFGGIYITHMRAAAWAELIEAEDAADAAGGSAAPRLRSADVDADGREEVELRTPAQVAVIHAEGGALGSWRLRAYRHELLSAMRRRPEAYHQRLRELDAARADGGSAERIQSIHDIVAAKEAGLAGRLHYDGYERRSLLVHLLAPALEREALVDGRAIDVGAFAAAPHRLVSRATTADGAEIVLAADAGDLVLEKRLTLGGGRPTPFVDAEVSLRNGGASTVEHDLAIEWNLNLLAGGGNPGAWVAPGEDDAAREPGDAAGSSPSGELSVVNEHLGLRVRFVADPVAAVDRYPVETITNSEAGFERTYQATCLVFRWPVDLVAGASVSVRLAARAEPYGR